jgi:predicted PurR-regulated permease PerM
VGAFLHVTQWVLLPFVISGIVAYLCTPLVDLLAARTRSRRAAVATGVFFVLVLIAALVGFLGLPPLVQQLTRLVTDLQGMFENLARNTIGEGKVNLLGEPTDAAQLAKAAAANVRNWIGQTGQVVTLGVILSASTVGVFLTLVLLFYFLLGGPVIARGLFWLVPESYREPVQATWVRLDPILKRYFIGVILVLAYASVAAYIGLGLVLGLKHAVFLALLTGVLEFIPMIGPAAAAIIAGLVALRYATSIGSIIGYAVYAIALRISIDQLLGPIVLGAAAKLRPPLIIFCFLVGGVLFGVAGVILAVPAALTVKVTLATLRGEPLGEEKPEIAEKPKR